jgi:hypothetical protein
MEQMNFIDDYGTHPSECAGAGKLQRVQCLWSDYQAEQSFGFVEIVPIACVAGDTAWKSDAEITVQSLVYVVG